MFGSREADVPIGSGNDVPIGSCQSGHANRATMAVGQTRESVMLEAVDPLVHRLPRYAEPSTQLRNGEFPSLRKDGKLLSLFHLGLSLPGHVPPP